MIYQLTTLLTHADEGRLDHEVSMAFFFRRMRKSPSFVVFPGLRRIMEHALPRAIDEAELGERQLGSTVVAVPHAASALGGAP